MAERFNIFTDATRGIASGKQRAGKRQKKQYFNGVFHRSCLQKKQAQRVLRR
jgi:hypothetical protein